MSRDIVVKARKSGFNKEELDPGTRSQARFFLQNQSGWGKILADIRLSRINSQIENSADMWLPRCNLVSFRLKSDRRTVTNTTSNSITMANKSGRPYLKLKSSISKKNNQHYSKEISPAIHSNSTNYGCFSTNSSCKHSLCDFSMPTSAVTQRQPNFGRFLSAANFSH